MAWIILALAGLCEVGWAVALKYSDGLARPFPSMLALLSLGMSVWLLAWSTRTLPVGTAYVIWVGIGGFGTAIFGMVFWGDPTTAPRIALLVLLMGAAIGLKLTAGV